MENRPSNLGEVSVLLVEKDSRACHCSHCGTTRLESLDLLPLIEQLVRSHAELTAALRWTGRQMLRLEHQDHHSLEKIRGTLRRAENIRRSLNITARSTQGPHQTEESARNAEPAISQHGDQRALRTVHRKQGFSRSNSFGVIKFPTG
jgi:hypothetical protein